MDGRRRFLGAAAALGFMAAALGAQEYTVEVIQAGLARPAGIVVDDLGNLYFTQLPTPGVPGPMGGLNTVSRRDAHSGEITHITRGEPEPTNIALDRMGDLYWTCKSAGVILTHADGATSLFLGGLHKPSGIAVDVHGKDRGTVYFTQVPTPGVPGGQNGVFALDREGLATLHLGEPEPTDIAVGNRGDLYWTCKSAGVILEQAEGETSVLLSGLSQPQGIAIDERGNLFFTEVPTPGAPGSAGGRNKVWKYGLRRGKLILVHQGDPEPADITVGPNGTLYWTCTVAGVIVQATPLGGPK